MTNSIEYCVPSGSILGAGLGNQLCFRFFTKLPTLMLLLLLLPTLLSAQGNGLLQFVSPTEGQILKPGESVPLILSVDPSVTATTVFVLPNMKSGIKSVEWTKPPYEATITIPESFSGITSMSAMALDAVNPRSGTSASASITFRVVPAGAPVEIFVANPSITLNYPETPAESEQIFVSGDFANDQNYPLDYPGAGTTYQSLDPAVATVDASGLVTAVAPGQTFVKIQNGPPLSEWAEVWVRDEAAGPPAPVEQTAKVTIASGAFRLDQDSQAFAQQIVITNVSSLPVHKPLTLILDDLPPTVKVPRVRLTKTILPLGSPAVRISTEDFEEQEGWLAPGKSATVNLRFSNPNGVPITYAPKLYTALKP
jgi:hypothetical protein